MHRTFPVTRLYAHFVTVVVVRIFSQGFKGVIQLCRRTSMSVSVCVGGPVRLLHRLLQHEGGRLVVSFLLEDPHVCLCGAL
jgi:hypothetical protein